MAPKKQPWFRFYTEAVWDRKLRREPPATRWLWVVVLAVSRQSPKPGWLIISDGDTADRATEADLVDAAALKATDVRSGIRRFIELGMLQEDNEIGALHVTKWDDRQYQSDDITARTRKHREKTTDGTTKERSITDSRAANGADSSAKPAPNRPSDSAGHDTSPSGVHPASPGGSPTKERSMERSLPVPGNGPDTETETDPPQSSRPTKPAPPTATPPEATSDEDVLRQTWTRLAEHDLRTWLSEDETHRCSNRGGWLRAAANRREQAHDADARIELTAQPGLTAEQLAEILDPACGPDDGGQARADRAAAAAAARAEAGRRFDAEHADWAAESLRRIGALDPGELALLEAKFGDEIPPGPLHGRLVADRIRQHVMPDRPEPVLDVEGSS